MHFKNTAKIFGKIKQKCFGYLQNENFNQITLCKYLYELRLIYKFWVSELKMH